MGTSASFHAILCGVCVLIYTNSVSLGIAAYAACVAMAPFERK